MNEAYSIGIIILQIIISGFVAWGVASYRFGKLVSRLEHLEKDNDSSKTNCQEIRDKVIACETSLKEREPLTKRKSPVTLTERGLLFLTNSGGKHFVDNNFDELEKKIEEKEPQTAFDVQELAKKVIHSYENDERLNPLKNFLFKDGSSLEELFTVIGIYLRDKVLEKKNWHVQDIDSKELKDV